MRQALRWRNSQITSQLASGRNPTRFHIIYCAVNAIAPWRRKRTRDAVGAVRHVFLEADRDGAAVLARIGARSDLREPSYVLHSSPNRVHIFWRVTGFEPDQVEALQKQLARELATDPAATPATQTSRLVGYYNHKYSPAHLVTIAYGRTDRLYTPSDFPPVTSIVPSAATSDTRPTRAPAGPGPSGRLLDPVERARRYLTRVPPAIAGEHGDVHTFRVCCRLVRGFALEPEEVLSALTEWNARCQPPWTERELQDKVRHARRYGHEPIAALLRS